MCSVKVFRINGVRFRDFRSVKGISQKDLADKLGVSRATIYKLETGRLVQSQSIIDHVEELFGKSVLEYLTEDVSMFKDDELELVNYFRWCASADRKLVLEIACSLSNSETKPGLECGTVKA